MFKRRTAFLILKLETGEIRKIWYNPKKLDPLGPDLGNSRLVYGKKREAKHFQKQLDEAGR